MILNSWRLLSL